MSQPQDPAFSLTTHLLSLDSNAFTLATQSPFLHHAGRGTLPKSTLQTWLAQDRLYAQAYIQFFSHLLSNITLPAAVEKESRDERLVDILIESLVNVRRELKFFEDVAARYGLELEVGEEGVGKGVVGYRALFEDVRKSVCATHPPHQTT
jgi:thiaminase